MTKEKLEYVKSVLRTAKKYDHAVAVLMYDQETICPADAMEEQGNVMALLENESYKMIKDPAFVEAAEFLYENRGELGELDGLMAEFDILTQRRGKGLMQGVVVRDVPVGKIVSKALENGLVILSAGSDVIRLVPPLVITKDDIDEMAVKLRATLASF